MSGKSEDEFDSDIGEDELNEELALPEVLRTISYEEKRELYRFKHTHNERDWEEEMLRRSDLLARKIDMERLKRMSSKGTAPAAATAAGKGAAKKPEAKAPARGRRKVQSSDEEGEESDEEESEPEEEAAPAARGGKRAGKAAPAPAPAKKAPAKRASKVDSDEGSEASEEGEASEESDDSDLFDSEEEELISKRVQDGKGGKVLGSKRKAAESDEDAEEGRAVSTRSSRRTAAAKYESDDGASDDSEGDEEEALYGRRFGSTNKRGGGREDDAEVNLASIKNAGKATKAGKGGYGSDDSLGGRAGGAGAGRVKKTLSVQDQMKVELAELMESDKSPEAEIADYWAIQPRRTDMIMKWLNEPFLKEALEGLYVRFTVGELGNTGVCRMCKIVAVDLHGRPYKLAETGENCTVRLSLLCGGEVRKLMRVCQVSNSRVTPQEFENYWNTNENAIRHGKTSDKRLTKNQARAMRKLFLSHTVQHVYTDAEIKAMVRKSVGLDKSKVTEYSTAMESLEKKLAQARSVLDYDTMEVVQKTIDAVQARFQQQKEKFDRAASRQMAVNRKMKESNIQRDFAAGNRLRAENLEAVAKGIQSKTEADPFSRRETRPKILWNTGKKLETARLPEGSVAAVEAVEVAASSQLGSQAGIAAAAAASAAQSAGKPLWRVVELPTLEQIRRRVKQRLGVDPIYEASRSVRERYLERTCARLPALHSEERALLRQSLDAKSLEDALEGIAAGAGDMGGSMMEVQ